MSDTSTPPKAGVLKPRVRSRVALTLLEAIRNHDLPTEVFEDEDLTVTMPRRLGLSDVIETQIRRYREDVRRGRRLPDSEIHGLFRLVIRRPDSEDLFYWVGEELYAATGRSSSLPWFVPRSLKVRFARREVERRLHGLFGRPVLRFTEGGLAFDGELSLFIDGDPGGDACHLVTGFTRAGLSRCLGEPVKVRHALCRSRRDPVCRWELEPDFHSAPPDRSGDSRIGPAEPGNEGGPGAAPDGASPRTKPNEEKSMIQEGEEAPDFTLPADDGSRVTLSGLRGKKVVLFFYPKDDTPGCTTEACEFRDALPHFEEEGAHVFGVSPDPVDSHRKFREKHGLNFPLLADEDRGVAERYGVWKRKSMFGKKYWGIERTTFLVGEDGRIEKVWNRVRPKGHAARVAEAVRGD